jgi:hypothetical protein
MASAKPTRKFLLEFFLRPWCSLRLILFIARRGDEAYKSFAPLFPKVPYVIDEAIRAALSVTDHAKAAAANPKDFYDNRFLQELESNGFVKELYSGK